MSEFDTFITHLDSRLEPIHSQLSKLVEMQSIVVKLQERDQHQAVLMDKLDTSVSEVFALVRAGQADCDVKHERNKDRIGELRTEFETARSKCTAVGQHHDELDTEFRKLNADYEKRKNYVAGGVAVAIVVFAAAQFVASDYYANYKLDKIAHQNRMRQQEEINREFDEQLKLLQQKIRDLSGGRK